MKDRAVPLCFLIYADYGGIGGALTRFRAEVTHFASSGHPVDVFYAPERRGRDHAEGNIRFHGMRRIRKGYFLYQTRLFFRTLGLRRTAPDTVFVAHDPISLAPLVVAKALGFRSRTILVMHGPMAVESYMRGDVGRAWLSSLIDRLAIKRADRIIAVSEYEKKYAMTCGADARKLTIIRNGVGTREVVKNSSFRDEMGIPKDRLTIGYLGTADPYRGTEFLLEAFAKARSMTKVPLTLILIFRNDLNEGERAELLDRHNLRADVYISRPRKDFLNVLASLDIYASHFSKKVDGIGFAIMEAMSNATPVVTGRDPITDSILTDGVDSLLVEKERPEEIARAIKALAEDPILRDRIGKGARHSALERLSLAKMLELCEKGYLGGVA